MGLVQLAACCLILMDSALEADCVSGTDVSVIMKGIFGMYRTSPTIPAGATWAGVLSCRCKSCQDMKRIACCSSYALEAIEPHGNLGASFQAAHWFKVASLGLSNLCACITVLVLLEGRKHNMDASMTTLLILAVRHAILTPLPKACRAQPKLEECSSLPHCSLLVQLALSSPGNARRLAVLPVRRYPRRERGQVPRS